MRMFTFEDTKLLVVMCLKGATAQDVAAVLGRSPGSVRVKAMTLRKKGIPIPHNWTRGRKPSLSQEQLEELIRIAKAGVI